jgi:hypothetical protein
MCQPRRDAGRQLGLKGRTAPITTYVSDRHFSPSRGLGSREYSAVS